MVGIVVVWFDWVIEVGFVCFCFRLKVGKGFFGKVDMLFGMKRVVNFGVELVKVERSDVVLDC